MHSAHSNSSYPRSSSSVSISTRLFRFPALLEGGVGISPRAVQRRRVYGYSWKAGARNLDGCSAPAFSKDVPPGGARCCMPRGEAAGAPSRSSRIEGGIESCRREHPLRCAPPILNLRRRDEKR